MPTVTAVRVPTTLQTTVIASGDTSDVVICAAQPGKTIRIWGAVLTGGTSITFKSGGSTVLSGVLTTTGLMLPLPPESSRPRHPHAESVAGENMVLTPGAAGLAGVVYYSQDS